MGSVVRHLFAAMIESLGLLDADKFIPKRDQNADVEGGASPNPDDRDGEALPFLRRYTVFNVAQCDNLPDHCFASAPVVLPKREIVPQAEALTTAILADIRTGGAQAFYRPSDDVVQIPPQAAFFDQINYYRTLFHEFGHWSGHQRRLNRDFAGHFGSKTRPAGRRLSLCLPGNKAADSGADTCSAPEF